MKDPIFTRHEDGSITVDELPLFIQVSKEFLRNVDPPFIKREGFRSFSINVSNASATYRIIHPKGIYTLLCEAIA